jgi:hypothetical protein
MFFISVRDCAFIIDKEIGSNGKAMDKRETGAGDMMQKSKSFPLF